MLFWKQSFCIKCINSILHVVNTKSKYVYSYIHGIQSYQKYIKVGAGPCTNFKSDIVLKLKITFFFSIACLRYTWQATFMLQDDVAFYFSEGLALFFFQLIKLCFVWFFLIQRVKYMGFMNTSVCQKTGM